MYNSARLAIMVVILLTVVLAAALQCPELAHDLGLEQETWTILTRQLGGASQPQAPRGPGVQFFLQRHRIKTRITEKVIAGRLTLFEAAALFRRLNDEFSAPKANCPDCSEEESMCLQVIRWVQGEMVLKHWDANAVDEVVVRLEEELRQHKKRHGRVILPEIAD